MVPFPEVKLLEMDLFPTEIWVFILSRVIDWPFQPRSLLNVRLVCQYFLKISKESGVYFSYRPYTEKIREKFSEEYKRHFFYNRLIVRYCEASGYEDRKLRDVSREEIIRLYTAHLFMLSSKTYAFIPMKFPVHIEKGRFDYYEEKNISIQELERQVRRYLRGPYLPRTSYKTIDTGFKKYDPRDKLIKFGLIVGCSEHHKCHRFKVCRCVFCGIEKHDWSHESCQRCGEPSYCQVCAENPWKEECNYCINLVCDECYVKCPDGGIKCENCNDRSSSDDDY